MRWLRCLPSMHDLPVSWDGENVEWRPWCDLKSTLALHLPAEDLACRRCGTVDPPLICFGLRQPKPGQMFATDHLKTTRSGHVYVITHDVPAWPVIDLIATRCRHCAHDTVNDLRDNTTWDLDPGDHGAAGSNAPGSEIAGAARAPRR